MSDELEITRESPRGIAIGMRIGPYKILKLLGEGGFGSVYLAEQTEPVKRRVALKIIKAGMDSKQVIARFEAERQALALMDHPHIAKVFDAGMTDTGRPFFVMELVRGVPLTEYCDTEAFPTRRRLELFIDVCRAVQHAHQKGIIHRDLKPSNVLVSLTSGEPVPKVIDFGIAKATGQRLTDKTLVTEYRQLLGTPAYMSPEQAEMSGVDIDTRSDIYSLGVLLYELLTGTTPFDQKKLASAGLGEIQRIIREEDAPKPSTRLGALTSGAATRDTDAESIDVVARRRATEPARLRRELRGDLDWIVMKCLEKDRARRYETANGLARDLERHFRNEPVTAGPPGMKYQMGKFVRRNRALVIGAAAVMLVLVLGVAGVTMQWIRAERQATKAAVINDFLTAIIVAPDPKWYLTEPDPIRRSGPDLTIAAALFDILPSIDDAFTGHMDAEADTRLALGRSFVGLSHFAEARVQCSRALEIYLDLYGEDDARTRLCRLTLGRALTWLGLKDQAEDQLTRALASARRQLGEEHPDTIVAKLELAQHYMDKHPGAGEAETLCREVLESPGAATRAGSWTELHARAQLAFALNMQFQNHEAMRLGLQTEEALRARKAEDSGLYLFVQIVLGLCAADLGDVVGAEAYFRAAVALAAELAGEESFIAATSHEDVANTLILQHRWAEAEPEARTAYDTHRRNMGERHPYTKSTRVMLIASRFAQRADHAELQRQAQAIIEAGVENHPAEPLRATNALIGFFLESGNLDQASNVLAWGLTLKQQTLEYPRPEPYEYMMLQARLETARGRFEPAAELFRSTLAQAAARLPEWTCSPASMLDHGTCELRLDNHAAAEALLLGSYDRFTTLQIPRHAATAAARLVELYEAMQRPDDVEVWRARLDQATSSP